MMATARLRHRQVEGAKAPSISARLAHIEAFLRDELPLQQISGSDQHLTLMKNALNGVPTAGAPPIKPRLEALIERAGLLTRNLDQLSHTIVGDGNPAGAAGSDNKSPFTIPDQLEMLENLLLQACQRLDGIVARF